MTALAIVGIWFFTTLGFNWNNGGIAWGPLNAHRHRLGIQLIRHLESSYLMVYFQNNDTVPWTIDCERNLGPANFYYFNLDLIMINLATKKLRYADFVGDLTASPRPNPMTLSPGDTYSLEIAIPASFRRVSVDKMPYVLGEQCIWHLSYTYELMNPPPVELVESGNINVGVIFDFSGFDFKPEL